MKICLLVVAFAIVGCGCRADGDAPVAPSDSGETKATAIAHPNSGSSPKVALTIAKHTDLVKAVAANKGQVVVVYFWARYDPVSMSLFPRIVQIEEKLHANGLVCISVSLDPDPEKARKKVLDFLTKQKAVFSNFIVVKPDDSMEAWQFIAEPAILIFGRDGKLAQRIIAGEASEKQFTYAEIEKSAEKLLKKP